MGSGLVLDQMMGRIVTRRTQYTAYGRTSAAGAGLYTTAATRQTTESISRDDLRPGKGSGGMVL
jgi:hypothetical protein